MEVLRSKIAERPDRDATIEGIYGSKGFFFQQRRGHLDLRGITGIDLEKVVREVDVDSLQLYIENITFCNLREEDLRYLTDPQVIKLFKMSQLIIEYLLYSQDLFVANLGELSKKYVAKKKSLSKKRRELAELEEATKHLRNQVKAKKQNISTLEDLLRENSRRGVHEPKHQPVVERESPKQVKPEKITFFVAGPDGLCVEFTERQESSISTLRKSVTTAFVSKKDTESENFNKVIRLVHKGILLVDDKTIDYYGIKSGDTVVAVIERGEHVAPPVSQPQPVTPSKDHMTEMIEFLSKQQDAMRSFAQDIKYGWENALLTIKGNKEAGNDLAESERRLLTKIDDKWNMFENGMKLQLESKLNDYQALLLSRQQSDEKVPNIQVVRRRPILGELEDDDDNPALNDINNKLNLFGSQLNRLEVKTTHTDESVDDLRGLLNKRPTTIVSAGAAPVARPAAPLVSQPVAKMEITPPVVVTPASPKKHGEFKSVHSHGHAIDPRRNKWNDLDAPIAVASASTVEVKEHEVISLGSFDVPVEKVVVPPPKTKTEPPKLMKPTEKVKAVKKEPPKVIEKKPTIPMVDIVFPAVYHTDDMAVFHGEKVLMVQLPENLPSEDVVFILRKEIANKVQVPLTRVTLVLRGKSITLDMDSEEEVLTLQSVKTYASSGVLVFKVNKGKPLTNAQLDLLVPSWQKARDETKDQEDSVAAPVEPETKDSNISSRRSGKFKKRRDWDDDVRDDDPQMLSKNMYNAVRGSLDDALSGISDREGLTDDELHQKMESLKLFTETLPTGLAEHMRNYKGKVTNSITQATIDSGSEDFLPRVSIGLKGGNVNESLSVKKSKMLTVSRVGRLSDSPVTPLMSDGGSGKLRRSVEEYNSEEDYVGKYSNIKDDSPAMASVTNSTDMRSQFREAGAKSFDASRNSTTKLGVASSNSKNNNNVSSSNSSISNNKKDVKDEAKLVNTTSTTDSLLYSPSHSVNSSRAHRYGGAAASRNALDSDHSDEDDNDHSDADDIREYATVSRVQPRKGSGGGSARNSADFGESKGSRNIDKTMLSSINTLPSVGEEHSDDEHYDVMDEMGSEVGDFVDLSQTVDSEGDMLVKNHAVRSSAVRRRADEYEREAAGALQNVRTPPHRRDYDRDSPDGRSRFDSHTFSNASKASNVSLFNNLQQSGDMVDDFDESVHSLAFSNNGDD